MYAKTVTVMKTNGYSQATNETCAWYIPDNNNKYLQQRYINKTNTTNLNWMFAD